MDFDIENLLTLKGDDTIDKRDTLIHKVFQQTEEGRELIALWKESLIMKPVAQRGDDMVSIGIEEGKRMFIRGILQTIRKVEEQR